MLFDSHCHLADEAFATDLDAVVARARGADLSGALCIISSDTDEELDRVPIVRAAWPEVVFATAIHPHRSGPYAGRLDEVPHVLRRAVERIEAVALGEMGLDYHYDFAPRDIQQRVFEAQVGVAVDLDLPVAIHTREATDDTHAILRSAGQGRIRGVMHCFTGSAEDARRALDLGFYLSLPGIVTFPKAGDLRDVVRSIPPDRLLVETDAPYLAPVPYRGKRNEPAFISETVACVAASHGVDGDRMAALLRANIERFLARPRVDTPVTPMV